MDGDAMKKIAMIAAFVGMPMAFAVNSVYAGTVGVVPEPGSLLVLGTGAAAVAVYVWWRDRK
jgi:hypothetical protein